MVMCSELIHRSISDMICKVLVILECVKLLEKKIHSIMIPKLTSYPQSCLFSNKFLRISVSFDNIVFYFIDKPDIIQIDSDFFFFLKMAEK